MLERNTALSYMQRPSEHDTVFFCFYLFGDSQPCPASSCPTLDIHSELILTAGGPRHEAELPLHEPDPLCVKILLFL